MNITSPSFFALTLLTVLFYYRLGRRSQNYLLLAVSYIFISTWSITFAIIFAVLTLANFYLSLRVLPGHKRSRLMLWLAIGLNLLTLVHFRESKFFITEATNLLKALGLPAVFGTLQILLPVGLSFYVVQVIAYHLDVHRKVIVPVRSWRTFALFMIYFPKLLSGPIERGKQFIPKLENPRVVDDTLLARSLSLIFIGVVRKVVIADVLNLLIPTSLFQSPQDFTSLELAMALLAYSFSLYNDFAGYTSIVRGFSGLLGIELSSNFNTPYFSRNFSEFWQRWHITLSNWLRDYIYTPSMRFLLRHGVSSQHVAAIVVPPLITMFVSGFWHDFSGHMLLWGLLHGIFLIIDRVQSVFAGVRAPQMWPRWRQWSGMVVVFILVTLAWVPFRMDVDRAFKFWAKLFTPDHWFTLSRYSFVIAGDQILPILLYLCLLALVGFSLILDTLHYRQGEFSFLAWSPLTKAVAINFCIIIIVIAIGLQGNAPPPFVYQAF